MRTHLTLMDTLCQSITCWFESRPINLADYPSAHHDALTNQSVIGWHHLFQGKLSQSWEILQGTTRVTSGTPRPSHLWAANIVTFILQNSIILWEERNVQYHGTTEAEKKQHLTDHYRFVISDLLSKKPYCLARDRDIFPDDPATLLAETSPTKLAEWIASRRPTIMNSIRLAKQQDITNNHSILQWLTTSIKSRVPKFMYWKRDRLVYDPYSKKKKNKNHRSAISSPTYQPPITKYLSLHSFFPS